MEALQPMAEGQPATRPPPPDFSKKSFAQMFTKEPHTLTEFPLSVHKGEVAIKLSTAVIENLSVPFKYALVGKFSHGRPALDDIRKSFSKLDLKAAVEIGLIDYRHVLLRFHLEADFHRVWTRGIWQIGKYPMRVFKWSPSFQTSKETSIVPVWFELPGLPCHLFEKSVLFSIMKAVGVPISVDAATLILARPSVARVNVETDLLRELPSRIWIEHGDKGEGFWQKIVPENLPSYCTSCFRQGHAEGGCSINDIRVQKNWKAKEVAVSPKLTLLDKNTLKIGRRLEVTKLAAGDEVQEGMKGAVAEASTSAGHQHKAGPLHEYTMVVGGLNTSPSAATVVKNPAPQGTSSKLTFPVSAGVANAAAADPTDSSMQLLPENIPANMKSAAAESGRGGGDKVDLERDLADKSGMQNIHLSWMENNPRNAAAPKMLSDPMFEEGELVEALRDRPHLSGKKMVHNNVERNLSSSKKNLASNKFFVLSDTNIEQGNMLEAGRDREVLSGKQKVYSEVEGDMSLAENTLEPNKLIQLIQLEGNASLTTKNSKNTTETASKGMLQFFQIGPTEEVVSKIMANPDVAMAFQNPRVQAAIKVCSQNPLSITKYENDKEIMDVFNKISVLFPRVTW